MPLEPFRFLHAANLFLDHQLHGVGPVPDHLRDPLERATLLAWERIVDAAITRQVDFVLLAGNSFDAADHSLTGQVALVEGLESLDEHNIPVFIVPGSADPDMAWRLGMSLPENVTRFGGELSEPVSLSRDGRPFVTIHHVMANTRDLNATDGNGLDELAVFAPHFDPDECGPFDIALLESVTSDAAIAPELQDHETPSSADWRSGSIPFVKPALDPEVVQKCPIEYWALGDNTHRQSWRVGRGLAHTPGGTQGISPTDTGLLGCTLVEVESDGRVRESFIPTARVRWENVTVSVPPQTTREFVMQQLRNGLDAIPRTTQEELWLVTWNITGSGRFYDDLQDLDCAHRLWTDALQSLAGSSPQFHLRKIQYTNPVADQPGTNFLAEEFSRQLASWPATPHLAEQLIAASQLADTAWANRLKPALAEVNPQAAIQEAHRLGWAWLKNGI
ncbi:MAG: yhaO 2 [Planctomycetaceae bacterium]|nr:yhaO 2 [Planctomycetaceae bacterium]